jgi:hypothetical protein
MLEKWSAGDEYQLHIILKESKVTLKWRTNLPENIASKDFPYRGSEGDLPQKFHVA